MQYFNENIANFNELCHIFQYANATYRECDNYAELAELPTILNKVWSAQGI